jgi:hypothetical protein
MHRFISIECALYKLALPEMEVNLYNESHKKIYYNPVRLFCLVNKDDATFNDVDTGLDTTQTLQFKFLRDDLKDINVVLSEGDIIKYDEKYYEVDNIKEQQYWMGRNDETLPIEVEGRSNSSFGFNISIIAETHLTRMSQLNLVEVRSGVNSINVMRTFPKNL